MEELNKKIDKLMRKMDEMDKIMKTIEDIETSLNKKYDQIKSNLKKQIEYQEILNQSLKKIQKENKKQKDEIIQLKDKVEWLERCRLETTLNLYPVIETENMDLNKVIMKIGDKIGIKIEERDILDKYRKPTKKSGKPGDIIVKCRNKELRDKIIEGIRKKKVMHDDIGIKCDLGRIYGNEELTMEGKNIYYRAMKLKYEEKWKFLWIRGGKTFIKKEEREIVQVGFYGDSRTNKQKGRNIMQKYKEARETIGTNRRKKTILTKMNEIANYKDKCGKNVIPLEEWEKSTKKDGLNIILQNIRSFNKNGDLLFMTLQNFDQTLQDVIGPTETWAKMGNIPSIAGY